MRRLFPLLILLFMAISANAQITSIWLGGSTDWDDPTNWTDGVPGTGDTATIPQFPPNGNNFPIFTGGPLLDLTIQIFGGSLTFDAVIYNTGTIINSGGGSIINNQIFINAGMVTFNNNDGTFTNNGTVDNYGTFNNAGTSTLNNPVGSTFNNYGNIDNFGLITNFGDFINDGNVTSTSVIENSGNIQNNAFMDIAFGGNFTNEVGAILTNTTGGFLDINSPFLNDGTLTNDGNMFHQVGSDFTNNGTLNNTGTFDLSGNLTNDNTYTNGGIMNINDSGVLENNDVTTNTGTITLSICGQLIQNANNTIAGTILNDGIVYALNGSVIVTDNLEFGSEFTDLTQRKAPDAKCRSGIFVFLDEFGNGSLDINLIDKNSFGFCGASVASRTLSQETFTTADLGSQIITLTITDNFGVSASCDAFITVIDFSPPIVAVDDPDISMTCPPDITVSTLAGGSIAEATWIAPTATTTCTTGIGGGGGLPFCPTVSESIAGFSFIGEFNESKYFVSNSATDWNAAKAAAEANGGHLAAINDAAENNFLANNPSLTFSVWIGFTDQATEGTFVWTNGQPVTYTNWNTGEPNDFGTGEDITEMLNNGLWNDNNETTTRRYVMEITCTNTPTIPACASVNENISGFNFLGEFNDSKYFLSTTGNFNWFDANAAAIANGGHLVTIADAAENEFVRSNLISGTSIWTGFSDAASEGSWEWVNGEPVTYTNWNPGEPNEGINANHARLVQSTGTWTDRNGNLQFYFVMEIDCQQGPPSCSSVSENIAGATFLGEFNDSKYYVSNQATNWNGAKTISEGNGGHLVVIDSQAENDFIQNAINPASGSIWTGLNNVGTGNTFNWVTGSPVVYTNWQSGEPNGAPGGHGARLRKISGEWTDRPISDQYEFVFEIPCSNGGGGFDPTGGLVVEQIQGGASGNSFTVGETVIAYRATDNCGNEEICTFTITVEQTPASITINDCPTDIVTSTAPGAPSASVSWNAPTATTDCFKPNATVEQTNGDPSGSDFLVGTQNITYIVTDSCGNVESCSFNITVQQVNAVLNLTSCPISQTIEVATGAFSTTATWDEPTGTSDCFSGSVQATRLVGPASGSIFSLGTTQVVYVLTDECGNSELCTFNIDVVEACPLAGTSCDDGNVSTFNDEEDGNCNCAGTPCPTVGTTCDDGDASTFNDEEDGNCNCVGTPCPIAGTTCDDGDASTFNDEEDGNCNCVGTPCPTAGTTCDDGDASTFNDEEDGNCNCVGTPCPIAGTICDDGDASTFNDEEDGNCNCVGTPCPTAGTTCDDGNPSTENDVEDGNCNCAGTPINLGCSSTENLALKPIASATQSSVQFNAEASRAIDGNTDGNFFVSNSVTLTNWEPNAWLEIDLGLVSNIETVNIFNREDCCNQILADYYILISDVPFVSTDLNQALNQPGVASFLESDVAGNPTAIPTGVTGRYVRVQLAGTAFLALAEVEVIGCVDGSGCLPAGTPCDDGDATTENDVEDGDCNCTGTPCPLAGLTCDDGNPNTENDLTDGTCGCAGTPVGGGCATTSNIALGGTATQSSTQFNAEASRAIDGITDGNFFGSNSVTLTNWEPNAWWEVDLGNVGNIETINVWNRTDCCGEFTKDYYVIVSDVPFISTDLTATLAQAGVDSYFQADVAGTPSTVFINRTGRYVRIQLQGTSFLPLAEVEVIGCFDGGGCPAAGTVCDDGDASTENDVEDGECNCAGTPCPDAGTICDDGNPDTTNDVEDGNCNCAGTPTNCPPVGTPCDDGDASTFDDVEDGNCNCAGTPIGTGCTSTSNVALAGSATQSSTLNAGGIIGSADKAIDGNTNGTYFTGSNTSSSVTATTNSVEPYWDLALDASYLIERIDVYNRTDGVDRSQNVYVLVSSTPFTATDLAGARAEADYEAFISGLVGSPSEVFPDLEGQYVRVQMDGSGYLVLAEVEVIGCSVAPTVNFAIPNMYYFTAKKDGIYTQVDWMMAKDTEVDFYEIEVSTDGNVFRLLETMEADQVNAPRHYNLMDMNPVLGENFYRLKIQDLDGTFYYSLIRRVNFDVDFDDVIVYPNPTDNLVHIALRDFAGMAGTIEIYNNLGQRMTDRSYQSLPSIPAVFDVSDFVDGLYTITIKVDNHRRFTKKFVVSRQ